MPDINFQLDRLDRKHAADYLGLQPSTLEADVTRSRLRIPFYRLGSRVYYRKSDLDHWLESKCRCDMDEGAA
jgi:excisionase family DNA binding protein